MPAYKDRRCHFCQNHLDHVDYKNVHLLDRFTTKYYKIVPRYYSGICLKHQKMISRAIKNARVVALIPFTA